MCNTLQNNTCLLAFILWSHLKEVGIEEMQKRGVYLEELLYIHLEYREAVIALFDTKISKIL
jgi:hypothetical protein